LNEGQAKLNDFGFSRVVDEMDTASYFSRLGTPLYMSPQVLLGD